MMTQEEFLTKLFSLYAASFNRGNGQAWTDAYKEVLKPELNIDYDGLYTLVISNYSGSAAPKPAYLIEQVKKNSLFIRTQNANKDNDYPVFETIIAEKGGYPYEFGIETNYNDTVKWLVRNGFKNIRLKFG